MPVSPHSYYESLNANLFEEIAAAHQEFRKKMIEVLAGNIPKRMIRKEKNSKFNRCGRPSECQTAPNSGTR
jgi:hypothetical protein